MEFKIGDKVKIISSSPAGDKFLIGKTGIITDFFDGSAVIQLPDYDDAFVTATFKHIELVPRYHIPPEMFQYSEEVKKEFDKVAKAFVNKAGFPYFKEPVTKPQFNIDDIEVVGIDKEGVVHFDLGCKLCGGTRKRVMFNKSVVCDCAIKHTEE